MSTCSTCTHWTLRDAGGKQLPMAKHHFGACSLGKPWTTHAPTYTCRKHVAAPDPVITARTTWLAKKG